jgi:broad specificity phosphatase PhoE
LPKVPILHKRCIVLLRALWFCGYARRCESLSSAKKRAEKAARRLVAYAQKHQSVALVGHGLFNMMIARELQRMGWIGKRKTSVKHWRCTTYTL